MQSLFSIAELKKKIGAIDGSSFKEVRSFSMLPSGFPTQCLIEITGFGKTGFLLSYLKEHPELKVAWVETLFLSNPYAFWQRGVFLDSILFVECGSEVTWVTDQILKSQLFQAVVLSEAFFTEKDLRKLQLWVEKGQSQLFLLCEESHQSWVPALQIKINQKGIPCVSRRRGCL